MSSSSSSSSNSSSDSSSYLHLPDECWESVFKHLHHPLHHETLSLVSHQFLSITNRLRTSLSISDQTLPLLPNLLRRFPNLTSLRLTPSLRGEVHALLAQIASSNLPSLNSLDLSHQPTFPSNGLREFSLKFPTLKSLNCSFMGSLTNADLVLIANCFPKLEELDVSFPKDSYSISFLEYNNCNDFNSPVSSFGVKALASGLKKLRKVDLSGNYFLRDPSILSLCKNCEFLEELVVVESNLISQSGFAAAIRERPELRSLSVSGLGDGVKSGDFRRDNVTLEFIDALVSLKGLTCVDLSYSRISDELLRAVAEEGLPLRKLVLQDCSGYSYAGISCLLRKCNLLQHMDLQNTAFLDDQCVAELSLFLGNLIFVNLSGSVMVTDLSFFAIAQNCPLITEIKMEQTGIGKQKVEEDCLMGSVVNSHVKFLCLARNMWLKDESVEMFASVCPSLVMMDLSSCGRVLKCAVEVLRRCCKIRHLSLPWSGGAQLFQVDFEVPTLFALDLSGLRIHDETLSAISKSCYRLKKLHLDYCHEITAKGVRQVVENCKQLRVISLKSCEKVAADVVAWMVFARPSLRNIIAPPQFRLTKSQKELFLRHGCLVSECSK